jgi:hypothetical protein
MSWFTRRAPRSELVQFLDPLDWAETLGINSPEEVRRMQAQRAESAARVRSQRELEARLREAHRRAIAAGINPDGTHKSNAGTYQSLWTRALNLAVAEQGLETTCEALRSMGRHGELARLKQLYGG